MRQAGSHVHLKHANRPGRVTVPVHAGEILKPKTVATILDQAGIELDEFMKVL
jgi:predicted RNA binding protein YcfA (HicA-like mRNA interferase family)